MIQNFQKNGMLKYQLWNRTIELLEENEVKENFKNKIVGEKIEIKN